MLPNQTATHYNRSVSGQTTTENPLTVSSSLAVSYNSTRISNKKQSKSNTNNNGNSVTAGLGGFQDQNIIRRIFNGTEQNGNSVARNKEGRQKNNRKQISGGAGGAALNFDDSGQAEWSERDSANYTEPKYYLGKLIQGTYCSRVFSDCEKRPCRMQSPNFPGVYPRNLTCFYAVRQVSFELCVKNM